MISRALQLWGLLSCCYLTLCLCVNRQRQAWCHLGCKASLNAKTPFRSDQLICCAESQRQREAGGANIAGLQEPEAEDLETQGSQSDDDLQFEPQTSGTLTCCTPAICTSRCMQQWHLLAVTTGLAAQAC